MDPKIAARFNDGILQTALQHYGIPPGEATLLDGFESFIYEFKRPDGQFILRIGHSDRRTPDLIRGEVDWINTLASSGVTVARAILSNSGDLVEQVDDGQGASFLCTAFIKAQGGEIRPDLLNDRFFNAYGRLLGRMHALAKGYAPSNPAWKRYNWNDPRNNTTEGQLPAQEHHILEKFRNLVAHIQSLPSDTDGFGIIHQDAHPGNFFIDEEYNITLFDFDDCVYGHFIYDIAMVIFYVTLVERDSPDFMSRFLPGFFTGYKQENRLDPFWLKEIPTFLKFREIDLFAVIIFSLGENPSHPWSARYMQGRRARIENDVPFLDFDWESMEQYL